MTDLARFEYAIWQGLDESFRQQSRAIANIGCGYCEECESLLAYFPGATLTVVDRDPACIDTVRSRLSTSQDRIRPIEGDAAQLPKIAPGPYDFALIRHPDISDNRLAWSKIFGAALSQVRAGGILLSATYATAEAEFVRRGLRGLPVRELPLDFVDSPPVALAGNDRYILLWQKC